MTIQSGSKINRRDFIRVAVMAGGGLMVAFNAAASVMEEHTGVSTTEVEFGDFLKIMPDGTIKFQFVKHEMGQGVSTSLAQLISEELCADWDKVTVEFPLADMKRYENDTNGGFGTGGSCSILYQWDVMRKAGATARQMLIHAAARKWKEDPEQCIAENHFVISKLSGNKLSFGELSQMVTGTDKPKSLKIKDPSQFKLVGKPKAGKLVPAIVTGSLQYGIDVKIPDMLYAVVERCPVFKGRIKHYDGSKALKVNGVRKVFTTTAVAGFQLPAPYFPHDLREGVVVVADSFWAAQKGREALEIVWEEGKNGALSSDDFRALVHQKALHRTDPVGYVGNPNAIADMSQVKRTLRASYVFPQQLHCGMEPMTTVAHVHEDGCDIWLGSQSASLVISEMVRLFGFMEEKVKLYMLPSGGGFGRRAYTDMAVEAAFISREAGNVPVKTIWTREDEHRCNLAHLFQHMEYQVAIGKDNNVHAWYEKELCTYTWGDVYANPQLPGMAYEIPNIRYDFENLSADELVQSSAWRGVIFHGRFLSECFIDEIANDLKIEPLAFRMSLLKEDRDVPVGTEYPVSSVRIRRVLELASGKAGWGKKFERGEGMGIAGCQYGNSYCAVVAKVTVRDRRLIIDKIDVAVDCGKIVNPSGVNQQITGGIIWGLTALFYGGLPIRNGRAVHTNFHQNKLLRMRECPPIDVHFAETNDEKPWNVGEISSPLAVPAVLNAIFAATGKRIRTVPLKEDEFFM